MGGSLGSACEEWEARLQFLTDHGAHTRGHSQGALLDHLREVHDLLQSWGAPEFLCDAGLFHSVYGTESFRHVTIPLELRPQVERLIGEKAESLAYHFGVMDHGSFALNRDLRAGFSITHRFSGETIPLDPDEWANLCELFVANALEQLPRVAPDRRLSFFQRFSWVGNHLSPPARAHLVACSAEFSFPSDET